MKWPWSRRQTFDSAPKPIDQMWLDMLGRVSSGPIGRRDALSVPAVAAGRNAICSISTLPLTQYAPDRQVERSPLLDQLDPDVPNVVTLAQTVEDLLFDSIAWWRVTGTDFAGFPTQVRHLDVGQVSLQPPKGRNPSPLPSEIDPRQGVVWIDGIPTAASQVIRFDSPNPAIRKIGGRAIRRAILLDKAAQIYADDPRPADFFMPSEGADEIDDDEIQEILRKWKAQRKAHGTAYVPKALRYETVDVPSPRELQIVELQRQVTLDIANLFGSDPEDMGVSTTSRTYQNAVDRRRDRINDTLSPYMRAITDRLSMGDVTRRGYWVAFDLDDYMKSNPTERWATYKTARELGAMTVEEIREAENKPSLPGNEAQPEQGATVVPIAAGRGVAVGFNRGGVIPANATAELTVGERVRTFDGPETFQMDVPVEEFSVDREGRTIEGLAVPFGQYGQKGGVTFRFDRSSLQWDAEHPGRVKLVFPRHGDAVGRAIQLRATSGGLMARFKIGRGEQGDRALQAAEDEIFDGLSVGVDFDPSTDAVPDPRRRDALLVRRADLRHVALTDEPVFNDARVTRVAASRTTGETMSETTTEATEPEAHAEGSEAPGASPAQTTQTFTADQVRAMLEAVSGGTRAPLVPPAEEEGPTPVNPTRQLTLDRVDEPVPYRFDRRGNFVPGQEFVFSADVHEMVRSGDMSGEWTDAGKRVMGLMRATFSDVDSADINEVNPTIQRPDMYVDQRDYRYPIWNSIDRGAPPNGVQPFMFPKFSSASGLVGDHTEGTEPTGGTFVTTSQTVTPTPISGKASITREVWDMGGNPAVSTLIFNQMVRGWNEGLESAAATFLNTLTAETDINLGAGVVDTALGDAWNLALAGLQFVRGYDFSTFVIERELFEAFAEANDETGGTGKGRPLFPMIGPANTNGMAGLRFQTLNLGGVVGVPSWALATTTGSPNNSWLYDPSTVFGWASVPQRLEFAGSGGAASGVDYKPVAYVDLAIWGYKALANTDIDGVRQVIYDPTA